MVSPSTMQIPKQLIIIIMALLACDARGAGKDSIPPEIVGIWVTADFKGEKSQDWDFPVPVAGAVIYLLADGKGAMAAAEAGGYLNAVYNANTKTLVFANAEKTDDDPPLKDYFLYDDKAKTLSVIAVKAGNEVIEKPKRNERARAKFTRVQANISARMSLWIEKQLKRK